ncbi:hypothetical protein HJG53_02620 [Sphingomonas sp. ID1715]|uniref:hypothetical protein n=1 Tax=Sphingomonas sp. ID1715 TaxID=1656898 RepID=UPI0014892D33|nr:hypothetical protein [Sphingomonas sp. ID1715]NNM75800.1 hypothetical protein [Sphingomonas sp. ID1715]
MRAITPILALALCAGCSEKEEIADQVEDRAESRAEAMEEAGRQMTNALQANIAEQQARTVRQAGEERAEAIRKSDLDADALTPAQKQALVTGDTGTPAKDVR